MRQSLIACTLIFLGFAAIASMPAGAQERFTMQETEGGIIRLDTQSGQISVCTRESGGLVCRLAADDREALENEISRLLAENKTLSEQLEGRSPNDAMGDLPTDEEIEQVASMFEKFASAFLKVIKNLQDEIEDFESN